MIFDRTQNDVDAAITLRREKVQAFQELTESEIATLEKGMLTINTLNRIESKISELNSLLEMLGYIPLDIVIKNWGYTDIFSVDEFNRIIANVGMLRAAIPVMKDTPDMPLAEYYFSNVNDLEKILHDIDFLLNNSQKNVNFSWAIGIADTGLNFTS